MPDILQETIQALKEYQVLVASLQEDKERLSGALLTSVVHLKVLAKLLEFCQRKGVDLEEFRKELTKEEKDFFKKT